MSAGAALSTSFSAHATYLKGAPPPRIKIPGAMISAPSLLSAMSRPDLPQSKDCARALESGCGRRHAATVFANPEDEAPSTKIPPRAVRRLARPSTEPLRRLARQLTGRQPQGARCLPAELSLKPEGGTTGRCHFRHQNDALADLAFGTGFLLRGDFASAMTEPGVPPHVAQARSSRAVALRLRPQRGSATPTMVGLSDIHRLSWLDLLHPATRGSISVWRRSLLTSASSFRICIGSSPATLAVCTSNISGCIKNACGPPACRHIAKSGRRIKTARVFYSDQNAWRPRRRAGGAWFSARAAGGCLTGKFRHGGLRMVVWALPRTERERPERDLVLPRQAPLGFPGPFQ